MAVLAISSQSHRPILGNLLGCCGIDGFGAVGEGVQLETNRGPDSRSGQLVEKVASR